MKMKRYYYVSDNLDDLDILEEELNSAGVTFEQIHVLSNDSAGLENHHLHEVHSILKKDIMMFQENSQKVYFNE